MTYCLDRIRGGELEGECYGPVTNCMGEHHYPGAAATGKIVRGGRIKIVEKFKEVKGKERD